MVGRHAFQSSGAGLQDIFPHTRRFCPDVCTEKPVLANSFIGTENSVLAIALEDLDKLVFKSLARRSGGRLPPDKHADPCDAGNSSLGTQF